MLVASLVTPVDATMSSGGGESATRVLAASPVHTVTLISGDRITLVGQDQAMIHRVPGREKVTYLSQRINDDLYVIPNDAMPLLQADVLDRRLFNVSLLMEFGYHDQRTDLPLIITGGGMAAPATMPQRSAAVEVVRDLPAINGAAIEVDKPALGEFWANLVDQTTGFAATNRSKVWLDGLRQPLLEQSVPQVGAPTAWEAGWDGTGVTVAVLDTGIDATHPDLADQIVASQNFTEGEEEDGDFVGHGTHVASIVAGTGAASDQQLRGVAPGAGLLDGKVCVEYGCADSWILAGMQWAVEQGADVVNLSLGGPDTEGLDPLEEAVENLTEQFGTLFVIAAGNSGRNQTIDSPGSADAALTVGAVDKADELAFFSSRGPRIDGVLKPDLTAPGEDIVAANSSTGFFGEPGEPYATASGTSMSSPHVAGAAAILRQQHPNWSPAQLKAALMAAAAPHSALDPYAQGAGRLDLARAVTQSVMTDPPSVSFARAEWPHQDDTPQTATVTYHNHGSDDLLLTLDLSTIGPGGDPAPEGFFTLNDPTVVVPAGGSAQVSLTVDTSIGEVDGYFGGYLTATGQDVQVTTPFAVEREVESYTVTLHHTDRTGQPTAYLTSLLRTDEFGVVEVSGSAATTTVRAPAGEYSLMSFVAGPGEGFDVSLLAQPSLTIDQDLTVEVDARHAEPISLTVPNPSATQILAEVSTMMDIGSMGYIFSVISDTFENVYSGQIGPEQTVAGFASSVAAGFAQGDIEQGFADSPYSYDLTYFEEGRVITGFHRDVKQRELATVVADHAVHVPGAVGTKFSSGFIPGMSIGSVAIGFPTELPFTRIEYHNTDGGVQWQKTLWEELPTDDPAEYPEFVSSTDGPPTEYQARRTYRENWNQGVFAPALPEAGLFMPLAASRFGDQLVLIPRLFSDTAGRDLASLLTEANLAVYRDGELIHQGPELFAELDVPPAEASYRMEAEATRADWYPLSTQASLAWTFRSGHVDEATEVPLPVSVVRFDVRLDQHNTAPAGRAYPVPVQVVPQPGSAAAAVTDLTVEVSYDDGQTWQEVPVRGGRLVVLHHPDGDGFVSLRASATDADGNTVEQTVIRAYRISSH